MFWIGLLLGLILGQISLLLILTIPSPVKITLFTLAFIPCEIISLFTKEKISSIQKMDDIYSIAEGIRRDLK